MCMAQVMLQNIVRKALSSKKPRPSSGPTFFCKTVCAKGIKLTIRELDCTILYMIWGKFLHCLVS